MLQIVDRTLASPEENLAFDDSLLHQGRATLRFWESPVHFVVLGRSGKVEADVNLEACRSAEIPILRRSSGGGTVLQGPGCLTYALVLPFESFPELENVTASYEILLGEVARALGVVGLAVCGSDILQRGRKISGSAQRRTRGWLLHHGTILHGLDGELMERFLREPARRPAHRGVRTHRQFVAKLQMGAGEIKQRIGSLLG